MEFLSLFFLLDFVSYKHKSLGKLLEALLAWMVDVHHIDCYCHCPACVTDGCLTIKSSVSSFMRQSLCPPQRFIANSSQYFFPWNCISLNCPHCWTAKPQHIFNCPYIPISNPQQVSFCTLHSCPNYFFKNNSNSNFPYFFVAISYSYDHL